jgi:hypothetical protein
MNDHCPPMHTWRIWPAHGVSFTIQAECVHQHVPPGDWALHRAGGQIVCVMQKCGTVSVDETLMQKDMC